MQWLRHTRFEPPSIADQEAEVFRQERMKMLAAQADAKWAAKPSALDAPDKQQPMQMLQSRDPNSGIKQMNSDEEVRDMASKETDVDVDVAEEPQTVEAPTMKTRKPMRTEPKDSPWKQAPKGNPGDEWQPAPWSPGPARRRA
jgi:NADH dehydrogenase [ubiquinone] 1 alpha subcomplex assembly factor 2